ncbi:P-type DNA transfer ATPase VirB11 [Steroidobacter sp. S1-65]|uniref:Type IV secretion system protein n=1 Tax=Steroidobacter gossypii TaxID=2805490 RepID=A0ABS1WXU9_9GAMM|nr:P-type DNA transfer ATPase VirB11 [Steroidobacter gossypii]MBM0105788.1 P-type DNA transfer ATPase VirB11 [Steroidobacter gossypii]
MSCAPPPIDSASPACAHVLTPAVAEPPVLAAGRSALALTLAPLRPYLEDPAITEVCINRPGELFLETARGWRREALPAADFSWCLRLSKLIAHATRQRVDEESPLLSASLPGGARVQLVLPPATTPQTVAIAIRRPASEVWSVAELAARGLFRATRASGEAADATPRELARLLGQRRYVEFMQLAVASRQNILVSGPTGAGKTTFTKALIREIPADERLITIEDAKELALESHPNHVRLFYSKDDQGVARVSPKQLLEACLRMRPDRILLAELRAEEAFDYLRNVNSGHPGSITSVHAGSCELAFEQLVLLIKQSAGGRALSRADIKQLLYLVIDVVVQFGVRDHERFIQEIWYRPARRQAGAHGR